MTAQGDSAARRYGYPITLTLWQLTSERDAFRRLWFWEVGRLYGEGAWAK